MGSEKVELGGDWHCDAVITKNSNDDASCSEAKMALRGCPEFEASRTKLYTTASASHWI